jgi:hypothetical protein
MSSYDRARRQQVDPNKVRWAVLVGLVGRRR